MLTMLEMDYKVPWVYSRFAQIAANLYCRRHGKNCKPTKQITFSGMLQWWGRWQETVWYRKPEIKPVKMPANTETVSTQTAVGLADMTTLDHRNSYLDEVLDFYVKRSGTAFEDSLAIAMDNAQGYCKHCSHCKAELEKRRVANLHKWKYPNCKGGHPFADKRLKQGF